jgi:hypothetical protein
MPYDLTTTKKISSDGKIRNGRLILSHPDYFKVLLSELGDGDAEITVSRQVTTRSSRMNRYYFGVVIGSLVKYFNEEMTFDQKVDADIVHEIFKAKFLNRGTTTMPDGEVLQLTASTSSLTNAEFIAYWESIQMWAAEYIGLYIPSPNENFAE